MQVNQCSVIVNIIVSLFVILEPSNTLRSIIEQTQEESLVQVAIVERRVL